MRNSDIFEKKRGYTTIRSNLNLLLLIGCLCIMGCGHVTADSGGVSDNTTTISEQVIAKVSLTDDPGFMSDIDYPEDLMMGVHPRVGSHGGEGIDTTDFSSVASTPEIESEPGISGENATNLQLAWQKCLGGSSFEEPCSLIQTDDGGYLAGGFTESNDGDVSGNHGMMDYWIVKLDVSRNLIWQKCLGGTDNEHLKSMIQTTDGGYLLGGRTYSNDENVSGNHGEEDIWVVKLDDSGDMLWQKCLGGSADEDIYSVIQTTDGGYLVGGITNSRDGDVSGYHGSHDFWVVKLDDSGEMLWQKCLGGSDYDMPHRVIQTTDGGYLVEGYTFSNDENVSGNHGGEDIWVVKLDDSGNITWQKCLGGSANEYPYSVIQTTDRGYLISGLTFSNDENVSGNHGNADIWVVKLDDSGDIAWQRCLGGTSYEFPNRAIQTTNDGYLVIGGTNSNDENVSGNHGNTDIWVVNLDNSGNISWQKCLGGSKSEFPHSIIQTTDGGYQVDGYTNSNNGNVSGNHGNTDIWVVKLDNSGNMTWQKCLGGSAYEDPNSVIQTTGGGYLINGVTYSDDGDVAGFHGSVDIWLALLTASHPVTATADSWTIAYPPGTTSYAEGTNATYLAQARPGADLVNVSVDGERVGPVSNWTFSVIAANHTFATTGQPTPGQVHAYFTLNTTWGAVPLTVQFTNQSLGNPTSFSWNFGDGASSTEKDPVHTYTTPGRYSVTLRATNVWTGGIATLTHALTATAGVVPSPTPTPVPGEITAAFSADLTSGSAPMQVSFLDKSTGNPTSWVWDLGDGNISTSRNVTHIYTAKGAYSVGLTAHNSASSGSIQKSGFMTVT